MSSWRADLSLSSLSGLPDGAVVVTSSESFNDSGSLHDASPLASLAGEVASLDEGAALKTSSESPDDSRATTDDSTDGSCASGVSSSSHL